jgi:hypothetical protein
MVENAPLGEESAAENFGNEPDAVAEIEPEIIPEPVEEVPQEVADLAPVIEPEAAPEEIEEPKPKPKRASRAKGVGRAAPKRVPPKKKSAKADEEKAPEAEIPQPAVVRTGSADKHLISDEPVIPQSVSRPRSYSDLDAIPDDYD